MTIFTFSVTREIWQMVRSSLSGPSYVRDEQLHQDQQLAAETLTVSHVQMLGFGRCPCLSIESISIASGQVTITAEVDIGNTKAASRPRSDRHCCYSKTCKHCSGTSILPKSYSHHPVTHHRIGVCWAVPSSNYSN